MGIKMLKSKLLITILCFLAAVNVSLADENANNIIYQKFWQSSGNTLSAQKSLLGINSKAKFGLYFDVDITLLEQKLTNSESVLIDLPLPDGRFAEFKLTASQVMHPDLAAKYPTIKTFSGQQIGRPENTGQFDITPHGFHGVFNQGDEQVFIEPSSRASNRHYHNYYRKDAQPVEYAELSERLPPRKMASHSRLESLQKSATVSAKTTDVITYKLAIATTGEYATFHGGTKESTLAALVTLVNRLNDVYQRDLSMKFELVANNDSIIFTDSSTDPFDNTDDDIDMNAEVINGAIGIDNYDIGHLVGTGGGGLAGFRVVCTSIKAEGVTGSSRPTSDSFYIDYVAHEIGHQFGADHTFNGGDGACDGNRASDSAYEPGSASTIMGYAGICGSQNIQNSSDPYFHIHSIDQIRAFTAPLASCGTQATLVNDAPTVNAGADHTIPAKTPFTLVGSATDADGDDLTYSWEQFDLGAQSNNGSEDGIDDGKRPLFRTFSPTSSAERTFPKLANILSNSASYGEALPSVERELNFRLVVRDNQNNLVDDAMKINVVAVPEAFSINDIGNWNSSAQTITWFTANTENSPVSCAAVDILLSTDSGVSFSQTLVSNAMNDGSQNIILENLTSLNARIKIACSDNIFFAINNADFNINITDAVPTKPVFSNQSDINTDEDVSITLSATMLNFENSLTIDSLQIASGSNYSFDGLTITPNANFNGSIMVNMTATASDLVSDVFQVKVDIAAINDLPVAVADSATVGQDSNDNEIDVVANDSDIDSETITLTSFNYTGNGTLVILNNKLSYTPEIGFNGSESISYTIEDSEQASASAELTITVTATPVVPPPVTPPPVIPPTIEPKNSSSGGGSVYYLLMIMLLTLSRMLTKSAVPVILLRVKKGQGNE
jgi:hypothetical protein